MKTFYNYYRINIISILCALLGSFFMIVYWDEFTRTKKIILTILIALFLFLIMKNSESSPKNKNKSYQLKRHIIVPPYQQKNNAIKNISNVLNQIGSKYLANPQQSKFKEVQWYDDNASESQNILQNDNRWLRNSKYHTSQLGNNEYSLQRVQKQKVFTNQISFYIPQNFSNIFQQIKQKVSPKFFFEQFCQQFQKLRLEKGNQGRRRDRLGNYSQKSKANQYLSSLFIEVVDSKQIILLTEKHDVMIIDSSYCAEVIFDHLETKLQASLKASDNHFKQISQIVMKCFGLKVIFSKKQTCSIDINSNEVSISQLSDFLNNIRRQALFVSQKFKALISLKQFYRLYMGRLIVSTQNAIKLIENIESRTEFAFDSYLNILKEQFPDEKIEKCIKSSILTDYARIVRHGFFVHHVGPFAWFGYNRIPGFLTTNPIVVVLAFFAEIYKTRQYKQVGIVKDLNHFFQQKKIAPQLSQANN